MPTREERDIYPVGYAYDSRCFDSPESIQLLKYFPYSLFRPPFLPKEYWLMLHYLMDHGGHIHNSKLEQQDIWRLGAMTRRNLVLLNEGWWSLTPFGFHIIQEVSNESV